MILWKSNVSLIVQGFRLSLVEVFTLKVHPFRGLDCWRYYHNSRLGGTFLLFASTISDYTCEIWVEQGYNAALVLHSVGLASSTYYNYKA